MSLISVIIPVYKQSQFLDEAITSVLAQEYSDYEVIVVDDGSPDDEVKKVAGRYPEVRLVRQTNQGVSAARNAGVNVSKGEYLVFLDADDWLLTRALQSNLEHLQAHPECACVVGRVIMTSIDGTPLPSECTPRNEKQYYPDLIAYDATGCPAAVMFRRSIFESVGGFDPSLKSAEDFELYLRITRQYPIFFHDTVVAMYRKHKASKSSNRTFRFEYMMQIYQAQQKYVKGNKVYEDAYNKGLKRRKDYYGDAVVNEIRKHLRAGRFKESIRGVYLLLRYHPQVLITHANRKIRHEIFRSKKSLLT